MLRKQSGAGPSIRAQILLPLVWVGLVTIGVFALLTYQEFERQVGAFSLRRAQLATRMIQSALDAGDNPGELQRTINRFSQEPEFKLILVVADNPPRVLAGTEHARIGLSLESLAAPERDDLETVLAAGQSSFRFQRGNSIGDYTAALHVPATPAAESRATPAAIKILFDGRSLRPALTPGALWYGGLQTAGVVLTIGVIALLLGQRVTRPLARINEAMRRYSSGDESVTVPVEAGREIALLGQTLNDLIQVRSSDQARFRTIFESAPICIAITDRVGRMVETNSAMQNLLGHSNSELQGRLFTEFMLPEDAKSEWKMFRSLIRGQSESYRREKRFFRSDGSIDPGQRQQPVGIFALGVDDHEDAVGHGRRRRCRACHLQHRHRHLVLPETRTGCVSSAAINAQAKGFGKHFDVPTGL